jgi:hypothetical protein
MTRSSTRATDSGGRIPIKRVMNHWVAVSSRKMPREERWATGGGGRVAVWVVGGWVEVWVVGGWWQWLVVGSVVGWWLVVVWLVGGWVVVWLVGGWW